MSIKRRTFIRNMGIGIAATGLAAKNLVHASDFYQADSEKLFVKDRVQPDPAPKGYDRLPLEWYQSTVRRLKKNTKALGIDAILLESDANKVYYTGCFRGSGERTTWVLFPLHENDTAYWYGPGIDRDLITSWWCTEFKYYFCYPHAEGGYPDKGQVKTGKQIDLFKWLLEGLKIVYKIKV